VVGAAGTAVAVRGLTPVPGHGCTLANAQISSTCPRSQSSAVFGFTGGRAPVPVLTTVQGFMTNVAVFVVYVVLKFW
jgi:hypothetical protein